MTKRFLLLPLFLFSLSVTASDTTTPQKPDFLERVIEANQGDVQDPFGLTFEGTIKATAYSTAKYTAKYYAYYAFAPYSNPEVLKASMLVFSPQLSDNEVEDAIDLLEVARDEVKEAFKPTQENADYAKILLAQAATANLTYAAVRAATKEVTGYDAALLVKDSMQAVAAQTVTNYLNPRVPLMNNTQIASYVATDLAVAASMYAYKEMTGKNLRCPQLPIPMALRNVGLNEAVIGNEIYYGAKFALRTMVMDKLCGVTAPYISERSF